MWTYRGKVLGIKCVEVAVKYSVFDEVGFIYILGDAFG